MLKKVNPENLTNRSANTMVTNLGIEFTEIGENYVKGRMPVDERTVQPMGLLHGGASVAFAESLGSWGSFLCLDLDKQYAVGLEINANHLRPVKSGFVYGTATLIHFGKKTHIWDIRITDKRERLVCISRLTVAVLDKE